MFICLLVEVNENISEVFESKLTKLQQNKRKEHERVQKLTEEVKELRKQNEQLRKKCADLQCYKEKVCIHVFPCLRALLVTVLFPLL